MLSEKAQSINDFYDLANCSGDNIIVIALLVDLLRSKPKARIVNDLELLRVESYRKDFEFLLDNLNINTIKNLAHLVELKGVKNAR